MAITNPNNSGIDIQLPLMPRYKADPEIRAEFETLYLALRTLHESVLPQYTTAGRPPYVKGKLIYDTTLGKLVIGGAAAWEVVTSV